MSSPITPPDLKEGIPNSTMDQCEALSKGLLQFPQMVWQIFNWMLDSAGNITNAFVKALGLVKPGDLILSAAPLDEVGRLLANGQTVSRETYADLFAAIGTIYGAGDGSTTFTLPDYSNRFPRAVGSDITLGETGGADSTVLTAAQLPTTANAFGSGITNFLVTASAGGAFDITSTGGTTHKTTTWDGAGDTLDLQPKYAGVYIYLRI